MSENFNLSNKRHSYRYKPYKNKETEDWKFYFEKDIKEFIKRLKEKIDGCEYKDVHIAIIDKLAGDKLVEAKD